MPNENIQRKRSTVVSEVGIDYGHRVADHDSKCRNVHGHRGKIEIEVEGPLVIGGAKDGMVLDFSDLKRILMKHVHDVFDHVLILRSTDMMMDLIGTTEAGSCWFQPVYPVLYGGYYKKIDSKVVVLDCTPTAENLAFATWEIVSMYLPSDELKLISVAFWETPTNKALYRG